MSLLSSILIALTLGLFPALLWLFFWLQEDKKHPEPKPRILLTFLCGMIAVPVVIPFQEFTKSLFGDSLATTFILWALIEEFFKFFAAYVTSLKSKEMDEPIDALIYMITAALGFVALENTLFMIDPLLHGHIADAIVTINWRFVGSSLLHIISSATIGIFIAYSFNKTKMQKFIYLIAGFILSIALHASFNLSIINVENSMTLFVFCFVWIAIITLILFFEKVKNIKVKAIN
jgi:RsiW-degrading membrane proteinase PrsW (M82 family)